jgi:hypothetical protein
MGGTQAAGAFFSRGRVKATGRGGDEVDSPYETEGAWNGKCNELSQYQYTAWSEKHRMAEPAAQGSRCPDVKDMKQLRTWCEHVWQIERHGVRRALPRYLPQIEAMA